MSDAATDIGLLADYLALVYHEARNVRHLSQGGYIDAAPWASLISLPVNRERAWRELQSTRAKARLAHTAAEALSLFRRRFHVSLPQLIELYQHKAWRGAAYGGNAWNGIAQGVLDVAECLEAGRIVEAREILARLAQARHNTGLVSEKLHRLDRVLESAV